MPRVVIEPIGTSAASDQLKLFTQIRTSLGTLQTQLLANPYVSFTAGPTESGLQRGDPIFRLTKENVLQVGVFDGKQPRYLTPDDLQVLQKRGTNFLGIQTGTAAPTTVNNFPEPNDWGFYDRTAGAPGLYICYHRPSTGTLSTLLL